VCACACIFVRVSDINRHSDENKLQTMCVRLSVSMCVCAYGCRLHFQELHQALELRENELLADARKQMMAKVLRVCVCLYVSYIYYSYMSTRTHTHTYIYTYTCIHLDTSMFSYIDISMFSHTRVCAYICTYICKYINTCVFVYHIFITPVAGSILDSEI